MFCSCFLTLGLVFVCWGLGEEGFFGDGKCYGLRMMLRLPAQKHAPINLTMTLKTVDLILSSKGSIFRGLYLVIHTQILPCSAYLWVMSFLVHCCESTSIGVNGYFPWISLSWLCFVGWRGSFEQLAPTKRMVIVQSYHQMCITCVRNDLWLSLFFQGEALTSHYVSAVTHWTY